MRASSVYNRSHPAWPILNWQIALNFSLKPCCLFFFQKPNLAKFGIFGLYCLHFCQITNFLILKPFSVSCQAAWSWSGKPAAGGVYVQLHTCRAGAKQNAKMHNRFENCLRKKIDLILGKKMVSWILVTRTGLQIWVFAILSSSTSSRAGVSLYFDIEWFACNE